MPQQPGQPRQPPPPPPPGPRDDVTDVPGIRCGHWTDPVGLTGCTVVLAEGGAAAAVDVRGAAPGTREIALLWPGRLVDRIDAVLLAGGSAFGLAAADGVMTYLREREVGYPTAAGPVPIVPAAILYDLTVGAPVYPDGAAGRAACLAAAAMDGEPLPQGRVGAATGATVGKLFGRDRAVPGGLGSASARLPDGATVGAVVAVNAYGDIHDPDGGAIVAGARAPDGDWLGGYAAIGAGVWPAGPGPEPQPGTNTTIAVVATDAPLDRSAAYRLAQCAHDGLARAIRPCHTPFDGDTIFALSTMPATAGSIKPRTLAILCAVAEQTLARAVLKAVRA
jgi:L-aminopeptidase/D-esterase-like protein